MEQNIQMKPIGIVRTPYKTREMAPKQGAHKPDQEGTIELFEAYKAGLKDLETFSHAIVLFYFHGMDGKERGIYATRGPQRPNHIGLTIVQIKQITEAHLLVSGVDMLDGTPILDIKPYIREIDCREDADSGWAKEFLSDKRQ